MQPFQRTTSSSACFGVEAGWRIARELFGGELRLWWPVRFAAGIHVASRAAVFTVTSTNNTRKELGAA
ncbi:hypothetical protein IG631_16277 [Alternaria alternata]|nr:hypothetical protein IG631_16277 [Alternaria alternata]